MILTLKQKIMLIVFGMFLTLVLLEIGLRIGGFVFFSLQEYRNKNSIKQKETYRILCLGESTTALGGKDSYPSQLEKVLNRQNIGMRFSVINKGIPAVKTTTIVEQLKANLSKYDPDMVITMMGINDDGDRLIYRSVYAAKITQSLEALKIYKLAKLFHAHILCKLSEIKFCRQGKNILVIDQKELQEKPIGIKKKDDKSYLELGMYFLEQEQFSKAEEIFKKAIRINPPNDRAYHELGECYEDQKLYDKAKEAFMKAIEINPENDNAYYKLGKYYSRQGKNDTAEEMFKYVIDIDPEYEEAYFELMWNYEDQNNYSKLEERLKEAIEKNPEKDTLYGILALLYEKQEEGKCAEKYFKKADKLRIKYYNPVTYHNYRRLKEIVICAGIKLVCVQYPMRSIEPLKMMLAPYEGIIFVDNKEIFKKALKQGRYNEYFTDMLGGDFGHCTAEGNRLLAENIANVIKEISRVKN